MNEERAAPAVRSDGAPAGARSARRPRIAHLRDLVRFEQTQGIKLPVWLDRIISLGIVTTDPKLARRQKIVNLASFGAALNSLSRVASAVNHESTGLVNYLLLVSGSLAILALSVNRLHRFGGNVGAMALSLWFLCSVSLAVVFFGSVNVNVYFVAIGVLWLMFGIENWRYSLAWSAVLFATGVVAVLYMPREGIAVGDDARLATQVALQSMVNAILIVTGVMVYALLLLQRAESDLERQSARADALLNVVLPERIADRLRVQPDARVADRVDRVCVLFADLAGFTEAAHEHPPEEVVAYLNELVRAFEEASDTHGVDKIKTIGDAYMAAGGLEGDPREGAVAIGKLALDMLEAQAARPSFAGHHPLQLRIGIHCGPVIAGVIGDTRISYDVWGDTVNVASRMETHGAPGRIHVSEEYRLLVGDAFEFEERGRIEIKGLGNPCTFFLLPPAKGARTT